MNRRLYTFARTCRHMLMFALTAPRDSLYCALVRVKWRPSWKFWGLPFIQVAGKGCSIRIGKNFIANSRIRTNSFGIIQRVLIRTTRDGARIVIGEHVGVSGCSITAAKSITIGNHVLIGTGAIIADNDAHPIDPAARLRGDDCESRGIAIGDNVFIGARAIILKGVHIGEGSVIGAGSVVTRDIPPYVVAAGNPARVVGKLKSVNKRGVLTDEEAF
ncbi:MAG TPA: acyltransferase [Verrucomicrobia bacterium]|nr:acyltransferase [Verrucomicrobiota bacterium]